MEDRSKPTSILSNHWVVFGIIVFCLVVIALIVVIVLGTTGTIFKSTSDVSVTNNVSPTNDISFTKEISNMSKSIPAIPRTRTDEVNLEQERPILEKLVANSVFEPFEPIKSVHHSPKLPNIVEYVVVMDVPDETIDFIRSIRSPDLVCERILTSFKISTPLLTLTACLSKAFALKKNALLLFPGFRFVDYGISLFVEQVEATLQDRWDVLVLEQKVDTWQPFNTNICRVTRGQEPPSGIIVNKAYMPRLISYLIQQIRMEKSQIDLNPIQATDVWVMWKYPLGKRYTYMDDMLHGVDEDGKSFSVHVLPPIEQRKIAICIKQNGNTNEIQNDCRNKFLKLHTLEYFIVTDPQVLPELDASFDYLFYIDSNYRIYQYPPEQDVLVSSGWVRLEHHNDSFWGKCLKHPSDEIRHLSSSYMYAEQCLDPECNDPVCATLRTSNIVPIMGNTA